jgi:hypothetical protein
VSWRFGFDFGHDPRPAHRLRRTRNTMTLRARFPFSSSIPALFAATCLCALPACGDDDDAPPPPPMPDAGMPDLGTPDLGPMYAPGTTCDDPHVLTGPTASISFDVTGEPSGMRDIGFDCGSQEAARWAPQHVVSYTVPGTGLQRVSFTTVNAGTGRRVDTVVQVRRDCERIPFSFPASCFDNTSQTELRSTGGTSAMGGETLFFIVTTFEETPATGWSDRGPIEFTIESQPASAPTVSAGSVYVIGTRVEFNATGMDADGDALGVRAVFLDAAGDPVDLDRSGVTDENDVPKLVFSPSVGTATSFSGTAVFPGLPEFIDAAPTRATQVDLSIYDRGYAVSEPLRVPLVEATEVGTGATCAELVRCRTPLVCEMGTCAVPADYAGYCAAAAPIAIAAPTDTTTTASVAGSVGSGGPNRFAPALCTRPDNGAPLVVEGDEALYTVTVPDGTFDLTARTNVAATPTENDTIVYVRRGCADPGDEVGCNDDVNLRGMDYRSRVDVRNVTGGTYTIFVEPFRPGAATAFTLEVSLRPVLGSGAACDPAQLRNRCSTGACPSGATPTCP